MEFNLAAVIAASAMVEVVTPDVAKEMVLLLF